MNFATRLAARAASVEELASVMRPSATFVSNHLRWGVFVTFTSASTYSRACRPEYGVRTDPSGTYAALWRPYHFIGLEIGTTIASIALDGRATGAPSYGPQAEVVSSTRRAMRAGETIDGEGGYAVYGVGLAHGLTLTKDVPADHAIGEADVTADRSSLAIA